MVLKNPGSLWMEMVLDDNTNQIPSSIIQTYKKTEMISFVIIVNVSRSHANAKCLGLLVECDLSNTP